MRLKPRPTKHNDVAEEDQHFEWVSENISSTVGNQMEGLAQSASNVAEIASNDKLDTDTKVTAQALNAVEAGVQAFGAITGLANNLTEAAIMPILTALGMKGMASLPISKQLDPVMGVDVHMVTIPPSPSPIPMPHPYIGMLFRSKDFLAAAVASFIPPPPPPPAAAGPGEASDDEQKAANANKMVGLAHTAAVMAVGMIGATVKIGGFIPRVVAGTPTKSVPHFPMGAGFFPAYSAAIEKNMGHAFLGSIFALADCDPIAGGNAHMHFSCWDVGATSPHTFRKSKNTDDSTKFKLQLFVPVSFIIPIPPPKTILTSPVPAPFNPMTMVLKAAKGAFGRYFKKLTKKPAMKLHDAINNKVGGKKLNNILHKAACTVTGHPVDVATGRFFTDEEDFSINGPIPLEWERTWYSVSDHKGPLGNGWHHRYDMAMVVDKDVPNISVRLNDGRNIAFAIPTQKTPSFRKSERLEMRVNENGEYYIWDLNEELFYHFTKKEYNGVQLLRSVVNTNGFGIQFTYNESGHLQQIIDSAHRRINVENDNKGRITTITTLHPENREESLVLATYVYDEDGNMIQQTNAEGDSMYFEYQNRLMVKETWRNGLSWYFKYDDNKIGARCIHTWGDGDIYNHKLTYYDGLTEVENSLGHITKYYHTGGLVTKRIDPNDAEHTWLYDSENQLLSETDPMGNCHMYSYDDLGNQTAVTDPAGATVVTEYTDIKHPHLPVSATDANGGTWKWKYDEYGNLEERTNPMGAITQLDYNDGLLHQVTDALGNTTQLAYNQQYEIETVSDNRGNNTRYQHDILGRCTSITNPKGAEQKRWFDAVGRVSKVHDFDGNQIELTYDGIDNLLHYKDSQQEVRYKYRGMWKLTSRTDKRGTTRYLYNTEEQLTQIVNEKNLPYKFDLDEVGNVVKETSFDQESKFYKRDLAGRVTQLTRASGKTTQYAYDKASR
ncbi:MAG: DUF6531 domain-containing protein, partial [Bacteroidales bacterium]|nr:DUF6531 domain-containing protein [Bacteroidales bacterium]